MTTTSASAPRPARLTLSRKKGYSLSAQSRALNGLPAKRVTRPGPFANPFTIADVAKRYRLDDKAAQAKAVDLCTQWLIGALDPALAPGDPPPLGQIVAELRGHNLACWCAPGTPCHADVLLDIANG